MIYNIVIYFVLWGIAIASLFNEKVRKMWRGEREAFKILKQKVDPNAKYIWFHAASLGEFEQGRPLMERIRKDYPQYKILLTFYSPSGYEVRKNYEGADIICSMPVDTRLNAIRFLRLVRPVMAFFIKYEFWSNFLHILKHRNIPTYSVSSIFREDQVFFKWYGRSYAGVLKCFTRFFVQNEESKQLLKGIGITAVDVVGDTRFDRVLQIKEAAKQLPICEAFRTGVASSQSAGVPHHDFKVFVAGSSWPPDENIFIPFFNEHKDWRLLIAPHVIAEEHLKLILSLIKDKKVVRYTQTTPEEAAEADVLIIDCFGLLSSMYNYGAKRMGVRKTVAAVENVDYVSMAESLDIGTIINKKMIAASYIYQMMLDADVMNVRFLMSANADVAEFIAKEGSKVTKKPVKELGMPIGVTIGGLVRGEEGMLVSGNTQIEPGDSVMVFCHNINMKKIEKYFI